MAKIIVEGIWTEEGKIGITAEKREELGEIGYIELPEVGAEVAVGDKVCEVETIKEVVDILAPIAGKIVAVKGDPLAPVNRGLNCIKGYFNAKIMYGEDRITKPLLRVNSKGEFDKNGKFVEVSWKRAFDEMEKQFKKAYNELGPTGIGVFG